jgi:hypothetical protein
MGKWKDCVGYQRGRDDLVVAEQNHEDSQCSGRDLNVALLNANRMFPLIQLPLMLYKNKSINPITKMLQLII